MNGRELYHRICEADSMDAEVSRLSREELTKVTEYLAETGARGGVPAQVWGAVSARLLPRQRRKTLRLKTQEKTR
jgi:hypothetical protein